MIVFPTDQTPYITTPWDDSTVGGDGSGGGNGKLWEVDAKGRWSPYVPPVVSGAGAFADLTDKATADLPTINTPLANALNGKLSVATAASTYAPIIHTQAVSTISDSTTLGRSLVTAASADAALTSLGAGAKGKLLLACATPSAALTELGAGTAGASLFTAATETAAHTTLGRRVFHLDATETVNTLTAATFPGLSAISLKANTHYRISGWLRWECIAASFNLNLGFTGTGIDFDGTETNGRSFILTNATGGVEAMNNQSASSTRPFFTGVSSITRKCRSTFDGFILTAGNATNMNVQIVNRIAASGTVAVRDGVIIIEEVF